MREVLTVVTPQTSLAAAARLFSERHIGGAPVVDEAQTVVGVVSRSDLLDRSRAREDHHGDARYYVLLHGRALDTEQVRDVADAATPGVVGDVMSHRVLS